MSNEKIDVAAVIGLLEARRAALDNAIAALRAAEAMGAFGPMQEGAMATTAMPFSASGAMVGEVPDGAFHGKSMPAAIKLYLELVRSKKTLSEIAEGLKKGGLESTSKFFNKIVYATLDRLRKAGEIVKIGSAWGLPSWYPALMRAESKTKPRRGRPRKAIPKGPKLLASGGSGKPVLRKRAGMKSEPSAGDMIDWFLRDNPGSHTAEEILAATKIGNLKVAKMVLGTMVKRGKVNKTEDGKYRKAS